MMEASLKQTAAGDRRICRSLAAWFNELHVGPAICIAPDIVRDRCSDMSAAGAREEIVVGDLL